MTKNDSNDFTLPRGPSKAERLAFQRFFHIRDGVFGSAMEKLNTHSLAHTLLGGARELQDPALMAIINTSKSVGDLLENYINGIIDDLNVRHRLLSLRDNLCNALAPHTATPFVAEILRDIDDARRAAARAP